MSRYSFGHTPFQLPQFRWQNIDKPFDRNAYVQPSPEPGISDPPLAEAESAISDGDSSTPESNTTNPEEVDQ